MALHLERHDPAHNVHRFYSLTVQPDLFGDWSLVREWGRVGSPGRLRIEGGHTNRIARRLYADTVCRKVEKGYR